jgi:hypothetical protein
MRHGEEQDWYEGLRQKNEASISFKVFLKGLGDVSNGFRMGWLNVVERRESWSGE